MSTSVLPNGMHSSRNLDDGLTPHIHRLALTPSQTVADLLNITVAQADALIKTKQTLIA
jgi:hypothetical protein